MQPGFAPQLALQRLQLERANAVHFVLQPIHLELHIGERRVAVVHTRIALKVLLIQRGDLRLLVRELRRLELQQLVQDRKPLLPAG
jgi:hypothetical protein